jgi:tripartite-type tricarboxylate transporter receptor subunit TctC
MPIIRPGLRLVDIGYAFLSSTVFSGASIMRDSKRPHSGRRRILGGSAAALLAGASTVSKPLFAQERYPSRPLRIVVGFAPGGPTDIQARRLAAKLAPLLGQSVVVDNKPGAATTIAVAEVARAAADGYTLYFGGSGAYATTPLTVPNLPYDPVTDLAPIALVGEEQIAIAVHPSIAANNLTEFVALVRAQPGKFAFASSGAGNITHLTGELLKNRAGNIGLTHVAYKGAAPAVNDVLAGHVAAVIGGLGSVYSHHRAGKLRVLAITSERRASYAADIPTSAEAGMPGLISGSTLALLAPAATPPAAIDTLAQAVARVMADAAHLQEMRQASIEPITDSTPTRAGTLLKRELEMWAQLVRSTGLKLE